MSKPKIKIEKFKKPQEMEYNIILETDRDKEKFIKRVEKVVRDSMEYKDYILFLKDYVNMNHCAFFTNVANKEGSKVTIEIHHEPLTLFDIVAIVLEKHLAEGVPISDFYIAEEVMELHYQNKVGLIPLSKSIHQIVHHSDDIFIPINLVYGNYKEFLDEYLEFCDDDFSDMILDKVEGKIEKTKYLKESMFNSLNPEYVYIEVDGYQLPKKVEIESDKKEIA